jgi:NAD(P)-dependent dehydrogenase (short-subunit alcohol dehydrogenase family)
MNRSTLRPSTVVITGVTRGLGRAMVDEFVRLGHTVIGCARTKNQIDKLARTYPRHDFQTVDVASHEQVQAWAEHLLTKHGPPDFLINNAAVVNRKAFLWEVEFRDFSEEIDINIKGVVNVVRSFVPAMIRGRHGVIVNFSSRWGKTFEKKMGPYCATKWAVVALTRVLAEELKPEGVAVVAFNPGIVKTNMFRLYLRDSPAVDTSCFPSPCDWAKIAVPFLLQLHLKDTGKVLAVSPGACTHKKGG